MAAKSLDAAVLEQAQQAVAKHGGQHKAAVALGLSRATLQSRVREAERRGITPLSVLSEVSSEITYPDLPSSELPPAQLIEQACKRFSAHLAAREARRWMEIKINSNKPIALAMVGDPHL